MKNRLDDPEKQISKVEKELGQLSWDTRGKKKKKDKEVTVMRGRRETHSRAEVQMLELISRADNQKNKLWARRTRKEDGGAMLRRGRASVRRYSAPRLCRELGIP